MQQKVQFIGAILHDPKLIIMDEPFSGLDPANSVALKDTLLELAKNGKTILFSTHRMDQAERLCQSICLINHGRAVLEGDLNQIKLDTAAAMSRSSTTATPASCRSPGSCNRSMTMATTSKSVSPPAPTRRSSCT
jgi:ABC-type uncharacterized transport system ATPase subunit